MTGPNTTELTGLRGNHPLGFLAACGLLRIVSDCSSVRMGWKRHDEGGHWTAFLEEDGNTADVNKLRGRIVAAAALAADRYATVLKKFQISESETPVDNFRDWAKRALESKCSDQGSNRLVLDMLPSFGSEILQRKKDNGKNKGKFVIRTTAFAMTSGQQNLAKKSNEIAEKLAKRSRNAMAEDARRRIEEALFGPWIYKDKEHSLGFDPRGQRFHALMNVAPTNESNKGSVSAATFLAIQALPLFPCFVGNGRLLTTGFYRDDNREDWFSWPIWRTPITLDTLRSLLAHPFTVDLKARGVEVVYHCRRASTGGDKGDYRVFSHASERPWLSRSR